MASAPGEADATPPAPTGDLTRLHGRYGPALRRFFGRRVPAADVDDMVQDVFLKMQSADAGGRIERAESYLFQVARNALISRYRSDRLRGPIGMPLSDDDPLPVDELSPERILIARDDCARVHRAIRDLPPRVRAAFQFHRFENMSYPEIAREMGISRDRVKQLMRRAIAGIAASRNDPDGGR